MNCDEFLEYVDVGIRDLGYRRTDLSYPGTLEFAKWIRPLSWSEDFQFITLSPVISNSARTVVTARVGIESINVTHIENELELWECGNKHCSFTHWSAPMLVLWAPMHWLVLNGGGSSSSWTAQDQNLAHQGAKFLDDYHGFVTPFLDLTSTPTRFSELVLNLEEYPRTLRSPGPSSQDAVCYSAIVLFMAGEKSLAMEILAKAECGEFPQSVVKIIQHDPIYKDSLQCRVRRVKKYLGSL